MLDTCERRSGPVEGGLTDFGHGAGIASSKAKYASAESEACPWEISSPHEDDVMGHTVQSFLEWMTNESSGQTTEAVRSTTVHGREIGQGQGLPPPGSPENLPVHCGPQNTTCHSQA